MCILRKQCVFVWTGLIWLRMGRVAGSCERGTELSGSINRDEVLDRLSDYQLPKELYAMELVTLF
jgi:hypothetical protein